MSAENFENKAKPAAEQSALSPMDFMKAGAFAQAMRAGLDTAMNTVEKSFGSPALEGGAVGTALLGGGHPEAQQFANKFAAAATNIAKQAAF